MSNPSVNVYARGYQKPVATYKNILLPQNIVGKRNILVQGMMTTENARYIIKWDFDLEGETVTIPENCILKFEGGSLNGGTIKLSSNKILPCRF